MARELRVRTWCDACLEEGAQEPAVHRGIKVSLDGAPPLLLDLCQRHHVELVRPLLVALERYGVDPDGTPEPSGRRDSNRARRRSGPFKCQVPGCTASPLKHTGSLWQHLKGLHGLTMAEYRETYGEPVPMTEEELAELVVEVSCDLCGQTYSTAKGHRFPRQALVSHMWGHHAVKYQGR